MNYHWRIKPIKLALWAPKVHCQTKRNANKESKQAKLVQCKVFIWQGSYEGWHHHQSSPHPSIPRGHEP